MAKFYDLFYQKKDYAKEVSFIEKVINLPKSTILDAGCGTGEHLKISHSKGYKVFGFDLNSQMVEVANKKIKNHFEVGDLLTYKTEKRYDVAISFFAVFNHLKNYNQFLKAVCSLKECLKPNGIIIIDLHNPQKSGEKREVINGLERCMKWRVCKLLKKEFTKITYKIDGKVFETKHKFKIFEIDRLKKLLKKVGYNSCEFYENYDIEKLANQKSKNIQIVLSF